MIVGKCASAMTVVFEGPLWHAAPRESKPNQAVVALSRTGSVQFGRMKWQV